MRAIVTVQWTPGFQERRESVHGGSGRDILSRTVLKAGCPLHGNDRARLRVRTPALSWALWRGWLRKCVVLGLVLGQAILYSVPVSAGRTEPLWRVVDAYVQHAAFCGSVLRSQLQDYTKYCIKRSWKNLNRSTFVVVL